jgi:tetratricopeptide (TPR) repeat protein
VLARANPTDVQLRRDLSISYNKLGDLARAAGDAGQAERLYRQSLELREVLARANPTDVQLRRDLSVSYNKLGDLARAAGDAGQAERLYRQSLPITRLLHQRVPESAGYAEDLAITLSRLASFGSPSGPLKAEAARALAPFAESGRLSVTGERLVRWTKEE